jgi:methionyl-tRNA formyltransferase
VDLVFLGTPEFAVPTLERVVAAGHRVLAVYTQPDRPKGRGQQAALSPVKQAALRLGLPVFQPERVRRPEVVEELRAMQAEAMVIVGYGQLIPQSILDIPPRGIINVHASLLPKYRGAAPIQWAIARGENRTGVTTMKIDAGLDTGDMLLKVETEIGVEETTRELSARLATMGADLLVRTLAEIDTIVPEKQNEAEATYAPVLTKADGLIDWTQPAAVIANRLRGLTPWPGAWTHFRGQVLHIHKAVVNTTYAAESSRNRQGAGHAPGTLIPAKRRLLVSCGEDTTLELLEVQLEGRKRVSGEAFANGQRLKENERLESSAN